jgi:MYXO-CTERM domain-containing protein
MTNHPARHWRALWSGAGLLGLALLGLGAGTAGASEVVLDFEGISTTTGSVAMPSGYGGLSWGSDTELVYRLSDPGTGILHGTNGDHSATNAGARTVEVEFPVAVDVEGVWITNVTSRTSTVTVSGYLSGVLVDTVIVSPGTSSATWATLDFVGVDELVLTPSAYESDGHFVVDDLTYWVDGDGDGFALTDCDDTDAAVHPGAAEYCNSVDDDCDGDTDEDTAVDVVTWYEDADSDGFGNASTTDIDCAQPSGFVADNTDCDDTVASTYPGADEYCNAVDDDCDGTTDEDSAVDASTWYEDADSDGYGNASVDDVECTQPSGYVADNTDCDDTVASTYPGADEYCNGTDDDCDGDTDEDTAVDAITWHEDADSDGYGNAAVTDVECAQPSGFVEDNTDCDDTVASTYPGADEYCNGIDDDCDTVIDEDDAVDVVTWFTDADSDGYGNPSSSDIDCDQPSGMVEDDTDCDDTDASVYPGATELEYDGIDQDCDGEDLCDVDLDTYNAVECGGSDCDDEDETVNVDAAEIWYDGIDQDCDELSDYDADYDGFDSESYDGEDCDDADDTVYPGAPDEPYDGIIADCDDADEYDADGDGYDAADYGGDDCDDANSSVNVDATEVWYDGVDQDCDGQDDDQDDDGFLSADDCDDTDPDSFPGAEGLDENCDEIGEDGETDPASDTGALAGGAGVEGSIVGGGLACADSKSGAGLGLLGLLGLGLGCRRRRQD